MLPNSTMRNIIKTKQGTYNLTDRRRTCLHQTVHQALLCQAVLPQELQGVRLVQQ